MDNNTEKSEQEPSESPRLFLALLGQVDDYIESRYQTTRSLHEARDDALTYAASQLAWGKIQSLVHRHTDLDEIEEADHTVKLWEEAIEGVKDGNWSPMKNALQDYAILNPKQID